MITPLSGIDNYTNIHRKINEEIVGIETENGIKIVGQSKHFMERVIGTMQAPKTRSPRSGVAVSDILDALRKPIKVNNIKEDKQGNKSKKYVGKRATVSVNPDNGMLIQCNPTSEKIAKSIQDGKI